MKDFVRSYGTYVVAVTLIISLVAFFALNSIPDIARAQQQSSGDYWHSRDHYEVELDGEGDAFVVALIELEGISQKNTTKISLEVPTNGLRIFSVVQNPTGGYYYDQYGAYRQASPEFLSYTTEQLSNSIKININLKTPISASQKTSILITYQTQDIAKGTVQGYEFRFRTIQDPVAIIRSAGANVVVPDDMVLKGTPQKDVQYKPSLLAGAAMSASSEQFKSVSNYYYGRQEEFKAQNLDPGESFTVTGLYGDNVLLLYLPEIIAILIVLVIFIKLLPRIAKKLKPAFKAQKETKIKMQAEQQKPRVQAEERSFARPLTMGAVSGFGFTGGFYLAQFLFSVINYSMPNYFALALLMLVVGAALIFIPLLYPIFYMRRYGQGEAFATFLVGIFTAFLLLLFIGVFLTPRLPVYY